MVGQTISHANIQRTPRYQTTSFDFRKIDVRASLAVADKKPAGGVATGRHRLEWSSATEWSHVQAGTEAGGIRHERSECLMPSAEVDACTWRNVVALRNGGGCRGEPPAKERAPASE